MLRASRPAIGNHVQVRRLEERVVLEPVDYIARPTAQEELVRACRTGVTGISTDGLQANEIEDQLTPADAFPRIRCSGVNARPKRKQ